MTGNATVAACVQDEVAEVVLVVEADEVVEAATVVVGAVVVVEEAVVVEETAVVEVEGIGPSTADAIGTLRVSLAARLQSPLAWT